MAKLRHLQELSAEAAYEARKIRGFLELNPYICSGCGTQFQSKSADNPGFLPKDKFDVHRVRAQVIKDKQEAIKILDMAGIEVDSAAAKEILTGSNISPDVVAGVRSLGKASKLNDMVQIRKHDKDADLSYLMDLDQIPINDIPRSRPLIGSDSDTLETIDEVEVIDAKRLRELKEESIADTVCICQRCFRLQQYGQVEEVLRPGWSKNELLTPERFQSLLGTIKESEAVVLCIVDMFDLQGSLLKNLKEIAGSNPIVIAANKVDLLPKDASDVRITSWVHAEVKYICGLKSPNDAKGEAREIRLEKLERLRAKEARGESVYYGGLRNLKEDETGVLRRSNVHLVSCQTGLGIDNLMTDLMGMAKDNGNKVYVMGAANVGKSSFINRLVENDFKIKGENQRKPGQKKPRDSTPQATVSNLPGTTLDFLRIKLPNGVTMIDTPGLLNVGQLTSKLTTAELRQVIPVKPINAVTLRVQEGKCVLLGGLATIELLEGRPFFFTFFVSNEVKLHPTDATRAEA
jgi:ribosome biogenesis GTPase A